MLTKRLINYLHHSDNMITHDQSIVIADYLHNNTVINQEYSDILENLVRNDSVLDILISISSKGYIVNYALILYDIILNCDSCHIEITKLILSNYVKYFYDNLDDDHVYKIVDEYIKHHCRYSPTIKEICRFPSHFRNGYANYDRSLD